MTQAAALSQLQGRPNVLLLGDSLGDLTMADGVSDPRHVLTVGFLNDQVGESDSRSVRGLRLCPEVCSVFQVEERKESYVNAFDVVLVRDETMDVPNAILRNVISSGDRK